MVGPRRHFKARHQRPTEHFDFSLVLGVEVVVEGFHSVFYALDSSAKQCYGLDEVRTISYVFDSKVQRYVCQRTDRFSTQDKLFAALVG